MTTAPWPDHLLTISEWDALAEDGSRSQELVEGVLLVVPRPAPRHQRAVVRLAAGLDSQLPDDLTALADVEILIEAAYPATVRVPDVVVVPASRVEQNAPRLDAADVVLVVEVVSPGTGRTDRVTKLMEYADAGIPQYWLVDLDPQPSMTAHTLVDGEYEVVAQGSGSISLSSPVPLRIDLPSLITRR